MLIDSHCHIPHPKYEKDVDTIILEAAAEGINKFVIIGSSLHENKLVLDLSEKHPQFYCAIGIYPDDDKDKHLDELQLRLEKDLISSKNVVGIGECGIDHSHFEHTRNIEDQIELFDMQCDLSVRNFKPLIVHNRNGNDAILSVLKKYKEKNITGVMHCFSQDWEYAQKILNLGFYLSFASNITYPANVSLREIVKKVPNDRFLIETDSPFLPPQGHRGEINYPKYAKIVAETIAQTKSEPFDVIADCSYKNTCALFGLPEGE